MPRIGILDDDPKARETLTRYLSALRFAVVTLKNGADVRSAVQQGSIDVLLFDFGSGREDGLNILGSVRATSRIPIVIVSGRTEPMSVAAGLDAGADDYVTKPVALEEFGARLRSVLRRARQATPADARHATTVQIDEARFDLQNRDIVGPSGRVQLTEREALILSLLYEACGLPVSRSTLTRATVGQNWEFSMRTLDVHVSNLRSKLASVGVSRSLILTARNMGYQLSPKVLHAG
jgi:two-component system, OmpR family, response regulator